MLAFYLTFLIFVCMVWYAGMEGTMRVFAYLDLQIRFFGVRFKMWQMKRQLEKQLGLPPTDFSTVFKEVNDD